MKQFSLFVLVGAVAAIVNILVRIAANYFTSYEVSIVIAFFVALTFAFTLNKYFVFRAEGDIVSQYGKFFFVNMLALGQVWLVSVGLARYAFVAADFTWHPETVAHAIGVASPIVTSYYGHKYLSFGTMNRASYSLNRYWLVGIACLVCFLVLISFSSLYVFSHISDLPFGDQWELIRWLSQSESPTLLAKYLFLPHNEHIIVTEIFSIIDVYMFDGRNWFLIVVIYITAAALSAIISNIIFINNHESIYEKIVVAIACFCLLVSLVQWENLTWGFQTHFYFVNFGALAVLALSFAYLGGQRSYFNFFSILILAPLTVLSNGSGVLIIFPLALIVLMFREKWRVFLIPAAVTAVSILYFFYMVRGATKIGDPSLRTLENIIAFFFTMLGGPFSTNLSICAALGVVAVSVWIGIGIFYLKQFVAQGKVDGPGFVLFCFAMFVFASAGAAAYARVTVGTGAALAPRYATPILALWLGLGASVVRIGLCSARSRERRELVISVFLVCAALSSVWMNVRTTFRQAIDNRFEAIERTKFAILSNAYDQQLIRVVYPSSKNIAGALEYIRERRLSAFSDKSSDSKIPGDVLNRGSSAPACSMNYVDRIGKLSDFDFIVDGWVAHEGNRRAPLWVIAFSSSGRVIGFSRPLIPRPDVMKAVNAPRDYRGFSVPVHLSNEDNNLDKASNYILAVFNGGYPSVCRIDLKME